MTGQIPVRQSSSVVDFGEIAEVSAHRANPAKAGDVNEIYTPEELALIEANRERLIHIVEGSEQPRRRGKDRTLGLELERLVVDVASGEIVSYLDDPGVHHLLEAWTNLVPENEPVYIDGRLFGMQGAIDTPRGPVGISITLEPGSQLEASLGPSTSPLSLMAALEAFDDQFAEACAMIGVDWQLAALGLNPVAVDPRDVALIPKERYRLMDAYLSEHGFYARDMMRCSASTQVSIDSGAPEELARIYQLAVALGPILSFLTDNVLSWRGLVAEDTPTMARSRIWESVDPARCGTVPGTFSRDFSAATYVDWLMGVKPILFTSEGGRTIATGDATTRDIMALRELAPSELAHVLSMVFPSTRLKGFVEIRDADSLPPRLAAAFAAFAKGIFYNSQSFEAAYALLAKGRADADITEAHRALRKDGWNARVYGLPMATIAGRLIQLTENGLLDQEERNLFHGLSDLWSRGLVPRDLLLRA